MILRIRDSNGNVQEVLSIKGDSYVLEETDMENIAEIVIGQLQTESWKFTLENGSTVTKTVVLQ